MARHAPRSPSSAPSLSSRLTQLPSPSAASSESPNSQTHRLLAKIFRRKDHHSSSLYGEEEETKTHADSPVRALLRSLSLQRGRTRSRSSSSSCSTPTAGATVLLEGLLTLLETRSWRRRPGYFVLEQTQRQDPTRLSFTLRQYRVIENRPVKLVATVELSQSDVVSDLRSQVKHALELQFGTKVDDNKILRVAAKDEHMHARWLHALTSCIAKLMVQAETRHRLGSDVGEPAKVAPYYGDRSSDCSNNNGYEGEIPTEEIRAARQGSQDEQKEAKIAYFDEENRLSADTLSEHSQPDSTLVAPVITSEDEATYGANVYCCTPQNRSSESSDRTDPDPDPDNNTASEGEFDNQEDNQGEDGTTEQYIDAEILAQSAVAPYKTAAKAARRRSPYQAALVEGEYRKVRNGADGRASLPRAAFGASTSSSGYFPFVHPHPQTHSFNANGQVFTLDVRYELVKSIGTGAYGAVIAVKDVVNGGENLAVKKITNIFEDLVDAKRILREVRLLHHFNHKNITRLLDLSPPPSRKQFDDMYIITELMETDLHQVIYSMQPMSDDHVKYFLYQMLCALHHIHSAGVLHRDMKPSNILLNANCDLKVCDFGLARGGVDRISSSDDEVHPGELTEYVVTRWYRAPEIMLNCLRYTTAIDVWAVGCIFAEMLLREPLFPGNDYLHQLKLIIKFLGTPKQEDIAFVKNAKALRFLTKLAISKPKKWRDVFAGSSSADVSPEAIDLLSKMLLFNPDKRISVDAALHHPYLATFYDENDLARSTPFDFSFDLPDDKLTKEALVDLLCEDIEQFHPPIPTAMTPTPLSAAANRFFRLGMTASAS